MPPPRPLRAARLTALLAILAAPLSAAADRVVLKDGQVLEGVIVADGDEVRLRMDLGEVGFERADVLRIEPSFTPLGALDAARARLAPRDMDGRLALAREAQGAGLGTQARELLREVLALAPDHPVARAGLGYVRVDGVWRTADEDRRARGLVEHGGRWVTAAEAERLEQAAEKLRQRAREAVEAEAKLRAARAEAERAARPEPTPAPEPVSPLLLAPWGLDFTAGPWAYGAVLPPDVLRRLRPGVAAPAPRLAPRPVVPPAGLNVQVRVGVRR